MLEAQTSALQYPRDLALLDGFWTLLYTTNSARVPGGIPGGGGGGGGASASGSRSVNVRQYYDTAARRVENMITFPATGPAPPVTAVIAAKFDIAAIDTLVLNLVDIQFKFGERDLIPRIPLPSADGAVAKVLAMVRKVLGRDPPPVISPDVRTTYLGLRLRITRSSGGELRVFCRPE